MFTLLYVDDEPALLDIAKLFLETTGQFSVRTSISAPDALSLLAENDFDAIISDYQMPEKDGIEFLKIVRSTYGEIPFILFTGKGREEVVIEAINNGADFYLQKGGDPKSQFAELGHKIKIAIERRRATDALRNSEQRLSDIINFLPDATFAIDTHGTVIAWNREIEEVTGVPAADILGKGNYEYALPFYGVRRRLLIDLITESEDAICDGSYAIVRREGDVLIAETSAARSRGEPRVFLCKASRLYDKKGNVTGAIESIRDITEVKRGETELRAAYEQIAAAEEELRSQYDELKKNQDEIRGACEQITAQEEELRLSYDELTRNEQPLREITSTIPGVVYQFYSRPDGSLGMHYVSERSRGILGLENNTLDFFPRFTACVHPEDRAAFLNSITDAKKIAAKWHFTGRFEKPTGEMIWFEGSSSPTRHGNELVYSGVILDITDRKKAEQKTLDTLAFLNALLDQSPNAMWVSDEKGYLIRMNAACEKLLDITESEVVGKYNIFEDNIVEKQGYMPLVRSVFEEGRVVHFSLKYDSSDLTTLDLKKRVAVILNVTIFPVRDASGKLTNAVIHHSDVTEQKRAEDELRLFKASVDRAADEVFWSDFDGNILYVNDSACRTTGYSREELLAMKVFDLDPDFSLGSWEKSTADLRQRKTQIFTTRHRRKDGIIIDVEIMAAYVSRDDREYSFAFVRDITDRRKAEEAWKESDRRYRIILQSANDAILIHEVSPKGPGRFIEVNEQACQILGYPRDKLLAMEIPAIDVPEQVEHVSEIVEKLFSTGKAVFQTDFLTKDGCRIPVEVSNRLIDFNGRSAVLSIARDLSEQRRAEQVLRESERRFREMAEMMPLAVWEADRNGTITYANERGFRLFGYTDEDFRRGVTVLETVMPGDRERATGNIQNVLQGTPVGGQEYTGLRRDGSTFPMLVYAARIVSGGTVTGMRGINVDITERKQTELSLQAANRKLNLLNSITRHDIRNKITVLTGYIALVKEKSSDPVVVEYIEKLESAAETIREHIDFTSIYQDLGTTEPRWQHIRTVLPSRSLVPPDLALEIDMQDFEVYADLILEKVFSNLLDNTIRHGKHATTVWVSARETEGGLVIVWEDDGVGIPAKDKKGIFEHGYGKNTGLGLFLSREILSITGMTIQENGTPGNGARFVITVPKEAYRSHQQSVGD